MESIAEEISLSSEVAYIEDASTDDFRMQVYVWHAKFLKNIWHEICALALLYESLRYT